MSVLVLFYFLKIKVGSNLRPDMSGLTNRPIYCCFCLVSVVSPSSVDTAEPPCWVDNDNHHVSVCSNPTDSASSTVSSSKVLYCLVFATLRARYLPPLSPLYALAIVCFRNFSFHISDVSNLILDCSGSSPYASQPKYGGLVNTKSRLSSSGINVSLPCL